MTDPTSEATSESNLTRITVNLHPRAVADLDTMTARHGMNRTDVINRAVRLAAVVDTLTDSAGVLRVTGPDGTTERIHLL